MEAFSVSAIGTDSRMYKILTMGRQAGVTASGNCYIGSGSSPSIHFINPVHFDDGAYIHDTPISTSDRDLKKDIELLSNSDEFIYSLKPVKYRYKKNNSNRYHHGFIAQDVKESMGEEDWGVYVDTSLDKTSLDKHKALRYEELIADLVATVQSQNERISALESRLGGK